MVSFAHLITLLSALVAISRAGETASPKTKQVEEKFFWGLGGYYGWGMGTGAFAFNTWPGYYSSWAGLLGGSCFGFSAFPYGNFGLYNSFFIKASKDAHSVSRRAISFDAEELVRREFEESVTCSAHGGAAKTFLVKDCLQATRQLAEKNLSTSSVGSCKVALVSGHEKVAPGLISAKDLEKGVRGILTACANPAKETVDAKSSGKVDEKQVFMLITHTDA